MKVLIRTSKSQCEKSIISGHPVANQASDLWYPISRIASTQRSGMAVSLLRNIHETILVFNEADDVATIYTFNTRLKKRLASFADKYPNLCVLTVDAIDYGNVTYKIQKSRVSLRLVTPYSVERRKRRKTASEHAKSNGIRNNINVKVCL